MTIVQINGAGFLTGVSWTADQVQLAYAAVAEGGYGWQTIAFDPAGPNSGGGYGHDAVLQWTDTLIELDINAGGVDAYLSQVLIKDVTNTQQVLFDVSPDQSMT